ncbi:MAG: DUF4212 domain-containing protein [Alkalicoccus sp.]|jgi:putative solute:sodium symporter small subunit|uniref:DUF4212 domain-containing protein n=1 Tax=Alkalicoccus saliphilus TaxID=200989 RepID=A0A2T4U1X1_9BACI|nr:sodium/substrate symporter small subunit [Alkalicoccus saliphilus]PTL37399.1 DUF4212 domain-containing protein [Alkalicoccus saliphilus]TVP82091.1 MAG: DUF4212 domain-containing protein [Alkalicoccus sp.]
MQKVEKKVADQYFKIRTTLVVVFLIIGFSVSFGVAFFAEAINESGAMIMGMPAHYYMGAQGAVVTFVILLFLNAIISDQVDKKFGIDEKQNVKISGGGADH